LKRQLRSHDQDSFDARLADAVKPHEDAWRELSAQCSALEMALRDKQRIYDEDRQRLESELADTLDRERRLCEECDDLSEQLAHKDEAIEELRARCEEAEHQLDHIHTSGGTGSATKTEELVKLRQTVAALEAERQETRLARHTLENKLQETGDKNGALEVELENRREVLDQLRQDLEDAQRKTPALAKQLADYQERFTALDLKCQAYEADLAEAHAAMDDANREAEHLRRKLAQNLQADATAEVTSQTLVQELGAANAQWQEAQKEARHARSELGRIRAAVQELDGFLADRSLPEAVAAVLTHQASEADRLTQQIARIRETQEQDAYAHAAQARSIEVLDKKRAALEKQAEANKAVAEKAEQVLSQRERELDNSNKALKAQLESHAKQHQADEQQVKIRDGLLEAMLAKLAALLEADQQRLPASAAEAPRPAQDFGKFKEGLISCLQQLQQGRQLARGDQRQAESEARKKCARLEAQLRERTAALTKLEGKMHDLDLSLIEARQQTEKLQADNEELRGRRIRTSAVSRGLPSLATVSSATSAVPSTIHEGSEGGGESVAILRLRLEAMAKELKRMRELKAEEHSADKKRLAEQKRENRQLKNQMQLQLENGSMRTSSAMSGPIKYLEQ
jgi:chromosome segregation ATPase